MKFLLADHASTNDIMLPNLILSMFQGQNRDSFVFTLN